ncbi:MAG: hypothetical protein IPP27_12010 [Bacteroidetes bacterium]|nr:hypothetical protein [Bacteroidota bacterium]
MTDGYALQGLKSKHNVNTYYEENGKFVRMILKWDIFNYIKSYLPLACKSHNPDHEYDAE